MLRANGRVDCRWVPSSFRAVTGSACGETRPRITTSIEALTERNFAGIGFEPCRLLRVEKCSQVFDVVVGQRYCHRRHQRVPASAALERAQLLCDVLLVLAGKRRPLRIRTIAINSMASDAGRGFGL